MPPIGNPRHCNASGWLDLQSETYMREHAADLDLLPFVPELFDEIDRLRWLLAEVARNQDLSDRYFDAIDTAPANTRAQES